MEYPKEFIERCKVVYPTWVELHERLECGDTFAGRYLDDASYGGISADDALTMTVEELQAKVQNLKNRQALYAEWSTLYDAQRKR